MGRDSRDSANMTTALIEMENLEYRYPAAGESTLRGVSLSLPAGSITGIIGPSGSGKTTLSLAIAGIVPHMTGGKISGSLHVAGHDVLQPKLPSGWYSTVGMTLQDPESQLIGSTVEENLVFGPENLGIDPVEIDRRVVWALELVRMAEYRYASSHELSGGQKQRVAIASVLTMRPRILILDEPTSELDPVGKSEVFATLAMLKSTYDVTVVIVEHEIERLAEYADRLVVLRAGEIIRQGSTEEVLRNVDALREEGIRVPQVTELAARLGIVPLVFTEADFLLATGPGKQGGHHGND